MSELYYQPSGGSFSGKQPMKSITKKTFLQSIEGLYRYTGKASIGTFYPVRFLPGKTYDLEAEWPVVMPAGTIVSVAALKDARDYASADSATGIGVSGNIPVTLNVETGSAMEKSVGYLYPEDIRGLLTVCNGGEAVTESYSANDGTYGILTMSGEIASSSYTFTRPANKPMGLVNHQVYADMRMRFKNYQVNQGGLGIALGGTITIPYVAIFGSGSTATALAAIRTAVDPEHQYVWVTGTDEATALAKVAPRARFKSDQYGKFTELSLSTVEDLDQYFGCAIEPMNRPIHNLDALIDSFPGSGMTGMDTSGLSARVYDFVKSILAQDAIKSSSYAAVKANLKNAFHTAVSTDTANVSVKFGLVDVAFGTDKL
jgi:hypothetical protein